MDSKWVKAAKPMKGTQSPTIPLLSTIYAEVPVTLVLH